jgi:glycosyltransferase involved in cell wall biosynthesis
MAKTRKRDRQRGGSKPITIYLMCFNEEVLIPHTVKYYRKRFPGAEIVIIDNQSTDRSTELAKDLGCTVHTLDTSNEFDEFRLTSARNTVWKTAKTDWVLICDMDEYLVASTKDLVAEKRRGTTILKTKAFEMVGESQKENISNIQLTRVAKGFRLSSYDKSICFRRDKITDIHFDLGSHTASPQGEVKYSEKEYLLYHFKFIGLPYRNKQRSYVNRRKSKAMLNANKSGLPREFEPEILAKNYNEKLGKSKPLPMIDELA